MELCPVLILLLQGPEGSRALPSLALLMPQFGSGCSDVSTLGSLNQLGGFPALHCATLSVSPGAQSSLPGSLQELDIRVTSHLPCRDVGQGPRTLSCWKDLQPMEGKGKAGGPGMFSSPSGSVVLCMGAGMGPPQKLGSDGVRWKSKDCECQPKGSP